MDLIAAQSHFTAYGPSHRGVLAVFAVGVIALIAFGRGYRGTVLQRRFNVCYGLLILATYLAAKIYTLVIAHGDFVHAVPLQLSDFACLAAGLALLTEHYWAFSISYYWCLSLSPQALFSPALVGRPDFPSLQFLTFWGLHLLVIWAGIYLTWGVGMRPTWRSYRIAVVITACWAIGVFVFNSFAGTNYGFLNRKPTVESILSPLGPWPWYLIPEILLIALVWALMTWPWAHTRRPHTVKDNVPRAPGGPTARER